MTPAPRDTPSAAAVADLRTVLGREAVARAAGACRLAIVDRWAEGRHRPRGEDAHRMAHLAAAVATLRAAGVPRDALTALLATPDSGLGGRAPLDAIAAGEGERVVGWAAARAGDGAPVVTVRADGREVTVRRRPAGGGGPPARRRRRGPVARDGGPPPSPGVLLRVRVLGVPRRCGRRRPRGPRRAPGQKGAAGVSGVAPPAASRP